MIEEKINHQNQIFLFKEISNSQKIDKFLDFSLIKDDKIEEENLEINSKTLQLNSQILNTPRKKKSFISQWKNNADFFKGKYKTGLTPQVDKNLESENETISIESSQNTINYFKKRGIKIIYFKF